MIDYSKLGATEKQINTQYASVNEYVKICDLNIVGVIEFMELTGGYSLVFVNDHSMIFYNGDETDIVKFCDIENRFPGLMIKQRKDKFESVVIQLNMALSNKVVNKLAEILREQNKL